VGIYEKGGSRPEWEIGSLEKKKSATLGRQEGFKRRNLCQEKRPTWWKTEGRSEKKGVPLRLKEGEGDWGGKTGKGTPESEGKSFMY